MYTLLVSCTSFSVQGSPTMKGILAPNARRTNTDSTGPQSLLRVLVSNFRLESILKGLPLGRGLVDGTDL